MTTPINISNDTGSLYTPVSFYFTAAPGLTITPTVLVEGVALGSFNLTITETSVSGTYYGIYTPIVPGRTLIMYIGNIIGNLNIVSRSLYSFLQNVEDEALGSWTWDKVGGTLTLLRQNGTQLGHFLVVENLTTASREIG